jgi:CO/xanthine dehydrogenase FAD-binding subunit
LDKKTSAIKKARLVLSCLGTRPLRVPEAEAMLLAGEITGKVLQEISRAASGVAKPVKNVFGATVSYRKEMAGVLAVDGIKRLLNLHGEDSGVENR